MCHAGCIAGSEALVNFGDFVTVVNFVDFFA